MEQSEGEDVNPSLHSVEIDDTVREIFSGILDEPVKSLKEKLEVIKENKFGFVWEDDADRKGKVMGSVNTFLKAITTSFTSKHAEAAKHIESSTCDLFHLYLHKKLSESLLSQHPFEDSWEETKESIATKILQIKSRLEAQHDEQPEQKSDLEVMISDTDLFDPIHIHHSLLCCQVARDCEDPEYSERTLANLKKEHLLTELSVSYENENVPKYVMARCGNVLYVSFHRVQFHNFGSTVMSHRGEICKGINNAAKKIPLGYFAREIAQNKRLVFSGHSSGGAVASMVLTLLLEGFRSLSVEFLKSHFKCITFGLMPLGDSMLKEYVEAIPGARECFCHIVQKNDPIPKLFGSINMRNLQNALWNLVERILEPALKITAVVEDPALAQATDLFNTIMRQKELIQGGVRYLAGFDHLDLFGTYYILDMSKQRRKYSVKPSEEAVTILRVSGECLSKLRSNYLINHKFERYVHEVEIALVGELPVLKEFESTSSVAMAQDITPKITQVLFENIGREVVAKIAGSNMWFVHNVSIGGIIDATGKDLKVDVKVNVKKSSECEVQTILPKTYVRTKDNVRVTAKTHFENSKHLQLFKVSAKESKYQVTKRQRQLAKHSPREVIELGYLSAVLEHHNENRKSSRFKAIKSFFESAVSVVPLESIFHAMANGKPEVVRQCCEIICSSNALQNLTYSLDSLSSAMSHAMNRIDRLLLESSKHRKLRERFRNPGRFVFSNDSMDDKEYEMAYFDIPENIQLLINARQGIRKLLEKCNAGSHYPPCGIDLEIIYPSADDKMKPKRKAKCCKAPITLLSQGKEELNRLSKELIAEQSSTTKEKKSSNTNIKMLSVLTDLRNEFETCSTLLGAFMESQVQIPLEKAEGDKYVDKLAKHARSIGLSVWGLLILPFKYLIRGINKTLPGEFQRFVVEFSLSKIPGGLRKYLSLEHQFPDYDERLEFLVGSMKKSVTCNQTSISYSLERQLQDQCKKRRIFHDTSVDDILDQWNAKFEDETLTLIPNEYRRLVARWIKWSLMINNLRESLASQTAVGVIGLVNSGKSKFVRSLFGKNTMTGTTDQKRTTVPLIYNVGQTIEGLDVIDFPGVDDRDESIPDLAKLLLSLTRIIVFMVEYKRAHTQSTKQWLNILDKENVPVLICLTFADKLFAELMGENGDCDIQEVKLGVKEQLNTIKTKIGEPESGRQRDFKLMVFSFDNDSNLNTDEWKKKLRAVGLNDELDVGGWIAEKLQDDDQKDVAKNVIKFIDGKEKSTLNSNRRKKVPVSPVDGKIGQSPPAKKKCFDEGKRLKSERANNEERPTCSKNYNPP